MCRVPLWDSGKFRKRTSILYFAVRLSGQELWTLLPIYVVTAPCTAPSLDSSRQLRWWVTRSPISMQNGGKQILRPTTDYWVKLCRVLSQMIRKQYVRVLSHRSYSQVISKGNVYTQCMMSGFLKHSENWIKPATKIGVCGFGIFALYCYRLRWWW
jgi:hypothetical protein